MGLVHSSSNERSNSPKTEQIPKIGNNGPPGPQNPIGLALFAAGTVAALSTDSGERGFDGGEAGVTHQVTINPQNGVEFEQQQLDSLEYVGAQRNNTPATVSLGNGQE